METEKRSFDQISFVLTQKNIEIQSKCLLSSNTQLQYSQSTISIQNYLDLNENDLPMTIAIQHQQSNKFQLSATVNQCKAKTAHVLHFTDNFYDCFNQAIQKINKINTPQLKRKIDKIMFKDVPKSLSYSIKRNKLRSYSNDSQNCEGQSLTKRSKTMIHTRFACCIKQNQQPYDKLKLRQNEERKKGKVIKSSQKENQKRKINIQYESNRCQPKD